MSDDRELYARMHEILNSAQALRGEELDAHLVAQCGDDASLRVQVEAMLAADAHEGTTDLFSDDSLARSRVVLDRVADGAQATWLPEHIGGYDIVRQIGQGGMGVVYEAMQKSPLRSVAIKLLHPIHATADRIRRFRREAELLGRLQHAGIAQIFEASTYDIGRGPQPFFAMELVDGVDIRSYCEQHGLDRNARIALLAKVADAVDYAHELGVVHRDLKPDNVLVNKRGQPRVLDFGIARAIDQTPASTMLTEKGQLVGTLGYMAPEQLSGQVDEVNRSVDVYALGVMGFELLAHRLPFHVAGLTIPKAIATLTGKDAPRAGLYDSSLRGDVETILGKALDTDPQRRYQSAAELASDLRRFLAHQPIQARPPSRTYLAKKFAMRHRALVGGTLATLFALLAGTTTAIVLARQAQEQRDVAVTNEQRATASENRLINSVLQSAQILIDADRGRDAVEQLRFVPEAARGIAWRLLDRAVPFVLDEPPGMDWRFVDDEHLVGLSARGVQIYSLVEHRTTRVLFADAGIRRLAPGSDGRFVAAATTDEFLLLDLERGIVRKRSSRYIARGRRPEPPAPHRDSAPPGAPHEVIRYPEFSDDGRTTLWYLSDREAEVRVDGVVVRVIRDLAAQEAAHLGPDGQLLVVNRVDSVSAMHIKSGAVRFRYAFDRLPGASGAPVRGGVLLHSAVADYPWNTRQVWRRFDLADNKATVEPSDAFAVGFTSPSSIIHRVSYPRDGRFLTARPRYGGASAAYLADTTSGAIMPFGVLTDDGSGARTLLPFDEGVLADVAVSPSGNRLVVHGSYVHASIVELDPLDRSSGFDQRVMSLRGHVDPTISGLRWIYHVAISNDGSLIASAAPLDPHIRVWDTRSGECLATLERDCGDKRHANPGSWQALMAFDASGNHLVLTTPYDGRGLCLLDWNLLSGEVELRAEPLPIATNHLLLLDRYVEVLAPKSKARLNQRVQMQDDRALVVYEPPAPGLRGTPRPAEGQRWSYVPGVEGQAQGVSVHPSQPHAAVVQQVAGGASRIGQLTVVDTRSGKVLVARDLDYRPWCAAYSPDGSVLAIGTDLGRVLLFETDGYMRQLEWGAHQGAGSSYVYSLAWTPDGTRLVTASGDETVRIWDTRTRVASRLKHDHWTTLRAAMVARDDLLQAMEVMVGEQRVAARAELIRRAHWR